MPSRSATPSVMLWWTMSAVATSSSAMRRPSGCFRSSAMSRLPRWQPMNDPVTIGAHPVTADRFHLDDVGTEVGHHHRAERPGQELAEVEHADAFERPRHSDHSLAAQLGEVGVAVAQRPSTSSVCSPALGCGPRTSPGVRSRNMRHPDLRGRPDLGIDDLDDRPGGEQLRVVEALVRRHDRPPRSSPRRAARRPARRGCSVGTRPGGARRSPPGRQGSSRTCRPSTLRRGRGPTPRCASVDHRRTRRRGSTHRRRTRRSTTGGFLAGASSPRRTDPGRSSSSSGW